MHEELMEEMLSPERARGALEAVVSKRGAGGIDGMSTEQLEGHLREHWEVIRDKLLAGRYVPSPVREVQIPKPKGGVRTLGIPTVQDRFIQHLLVQGLSPIFDPSFSESSYGFRPGRSAHDAVRAAQHHVRKGRQWVVDLDISKFFDHVNHDILMTRIGQTVRDKRVLRLIGRYLRRGALIEGVAMSRKEGTPQGGPLSPLLANIYLDALDKELEKRGHAFCRYADDCNIYVGSEAAAERVEAGIRAWIEKELRLKVNEEKSGIGQVWERTFLGFGLNRKLEIVVSKTSLDRFKEQVREMWRGCQSRRSVELRDRWRAYLIGWWGYYRLAEDRRSVFRLEPWIRRRIRACFWQRWHNAAGRYNALRNLGLKPRQCRIAYSGRGAWRLARSHSMHAALGNLFLRHHGFLMPSELAAT